MELLHFAFFFRRMETNLKHLNADLTHLPLQQNVPGPTLASKVHKYPYIIQTIIYFTDMSSVDLNHQPSQTSGQSNGMF